MLQLSNSILNRPVMSLRTGETVAITTQPIINPNNLKIEGFFCLDKIARRQPVLLAQDIRDIIPQGIVINDYDSLSEVEDLIRLRDILALKFELIGKPVITTSKSKIGKVSDFAADTQTLYIQKLYVTQPLFRNFAGGQLGVDRNQIVEITNKYIVIQDPLQPTKIRATIGAPAT